MKTYNTIHEAYLGALDDVYFHYDYLASPRGLPIREKIDFTFRIINPTNEPIITKDLERNKIIADYTAKEVALYNSCSNIAADFGRASKFWYQLANPDGTINSAYGYLIWENRSHGNPEFESYQDILCGGNKFDAEQLGMRTPWEYCTMALKADKDTRQAILRFSLPEHFWVGNKDMTCTLHGNFLIRNDKLNFSVVMRSNDLNKGLLYDLPWFCSLMDKMVEELKPAYPNLTKGTYTHTVHSAHIYEKDELTVLKMLGK